MNLGYLQITRLCNQRCRICSNPESDAVLDEATAKAQIDEMVEAGYDGVIITGGEPTVHAALPALVRHCRSAGFHNRIITNGQRLADRAFLEELIEAGLDSMHLSIISHRPHIQNFVTRNPKSYDNINATLRNLAGTDLPVNVNIPINHYNVNHLREAVERLIERLPRVRHIVFDFLDPLQNRASENPDVIPFLWEAKLPLKQTLIFLAESGRTFRVERLPLCYMAEYAHCSTETRKIVLDEDRLIHFLDEKGKHQRSQWEFGKGASCQVCDLEPVCAGLWEMGTYHSADELLPVVGSARAVARRVRSDG